MTTTLNTLTSGEHGVYLLHVHVHMIGHFHFVCSDLYVSWGRGRVHCKFYKMGEEEYVAIQCSIFWVKNTIIMAWVLRLLLCEQWVWQVVDTGNEVCNFLLGWRQP